MEKITKAEYNSFANISNFRSPVLQEIDKLKKGECLYIHRMDWDIKHENVKHRLNSEFKKYGKKFDGVVTEEGWAIIRVQ